MTGDCHVRFCESRGAQSPPATHRSTEHTASTASTSKTGRFATLGALHRAPGTGAPARGLAAAPLLALCVLLVLWAGAAQAEPPRLLSDGFFASEGPGVAVDQANGDVYVAGLLSPTFEQQHVYKYDSSGEPISPPSPFGEADYSGAAVNPTNGDLYVLGEAGFFAPTTLYTYDPSTGALLSSFEVPASRNFSGVFTDVQLAADSAGNVYVPNSPKNEVLEYSPAGTLLQTFTGSGAGALNQPTAVAIDSSGNLWVADSANNRIVELNSSDAPVEVNGKPVEIESEGVWSVALDGHGDVFALVNNGADPCGNLVSPCPHLVEYSSEGRQLADVGAGSFGTPENPLSRFYSMDAVNEASGRVYVTDSLNDTVWMFEPPTAPVVDRELTAENGTSEAKLGALVNPGGIPTSYRFEYGPTSAYGSSTPFPEGSVGERFESHAVWAAASGLAAGTTYHFRVVATNELGTLYGPDQTFTTLRAEQAACPNEQLRGGLSARLPDCRAYELMTPPPTNSSQFDSGNAAAYASTAATDGEALTLFSREPQPGAPNAGYHYVTTRDAAGWIAEDIMPIESYDGVICPSSKVVYTYSDQLTKDVIENGGESRASSGDALSSESCNPEGLRVVSGEPVGYQNLLVRDNATGTYQLVNVTPPGVTPADAHFQAASADLSHVIFTETSPLAEGARYGVENLYEWDEGALRLVSVLPDGTAVPGSLAVKAPEVAHPVERPASPEYEDLVSSDGSHVLFTSGGALYDRVNGQRTVQVDEQQGGSGASGGGSFKAATADGSKVFFLDESKLTADSTAGAGEPDLYECALPEGASKCELSDLTVAKAGEHADVLRVTPLGGHDSSYVYFVAEGVLASNTREFTNSEGKTVVEGAQAGKQNLYLWNGEKTTFIATTGVEAQGYLAFEQTSPDGRWLAFESEKSLTGYGNVEPSGASATALFLYSAATGQLVCASCNPTGAPPLEGVRGWPGSRGSEDRSRRLLTDAGQMFFETAEALAPSDTNGRLDVYEYEGGLVYLISSGTSSSGSNLEGASESGDDVFFRTAQQLVPQDTQEGMIVIYDARVDGGFPSPSSPPPCTTADACREAPAPQPSIYGAPPSQTFSGVGNLTPPTPASAVKPRALTRAQKLADALKACKKEKSKRAKCDKTTRKKYATAKKSVAKRSSNDRRASR